MKIRLYDKFDHNETVCVLDGVKNVSGNKIVFEDGTTDEEYLDNNTDWEEIPDERIDSIEKYKDCFQPKSDEKPNSHLNEEVVKAFVRWCTNLLL